MRLVHPTGKRTGTKTFKKITEACGFDKRATDSKVETPNKGPILCKIDTLGAKIEIHQLKYSKILENGDLKETPNGQKGLYREPGLSSFCQQGQLFGSKSRKLHTKHSALTQQVSS